jgi:hypothetical protein
MIAVENKHQLIDPGYENSTDHISYPLLMFLLKAGVI